MVPTVPRRFRRISAGISADYQFTEDEFSSNHGTCTILQKPRSLGSAHDFRRMNRKNNANLKATPPILTGENLCQILRPRQARPQLVTNDLDLGVIAGGRCGLSFANPRNAISGFGDAYIGLLPMAVFARYVARLPRLRHIGRLSSPALVCV